MHGLSWRISFDKKAKKNSWSTQRNDNRVKKVNLENSAIDHLDIFLICYTCNHYLDLGILQAAQSVNNDTMVNTSLCKQFRFFFGYIVHCL